jgi:hypothetical protein
MDQNTMEVIEKLGAVIGNTGDQVLRHYTWWHICSAAVWLVVGVGIVYGSKFVKSSDYEPQEAIVVARWLLFAAGIAFIAVNVIDLMAPEGIAIHQIIKDITGK